jgi:hypothetical protein
MTRFIAIGALLLSTYTSQVRADAIVSVNVSGTKVVEWRLLPLDPKRNSFVTPGFKFFEGDKLVGLFVGSPKNDSSAALAIHTLPDGFAHKTLHEELGRLGVSQTMEGKTLIIYVTQFCPPCDHIVDDVKSRLPGAGWTKQSMIFVTVKTE